MYSDGVFTSACRFLDNAPDQCSIVSRMNARIPLYTLPFYFCLLTSISQELKNNFDCCINIFVVINKLTVAIYWGTHRQLFNTYVGQPPQQP